MSTTQTSSTRPPRRRNQGQRSAAPAGALPAKSNTAPSLAPPASSKPSHLSSVRFGDIPGLSQDLVKAVPFEYCTEVQAKTLQPILSGADVLAQAKTGTGKTLAFLVPAIQNLTSSLQRPPQSQTTILVLSPTRELAIQIADAATGICGALPAAADVGVQVVVGGTNIAADVSRFKRNRADILIATPGRLVDLLENYSLGSRLSQLRCLVLDEADRLLDQGFRNELMKILNALPDRRNVSRQTLLFSATIPDSVHQIASIALLPKHQFISTLTAEDLNTHERVDQHHRGVPLQDLMAASVEILLDEYEKQGDAFKVMCFLPTARAAALHYDIFQNLQLARTFPTWEIHSRMSQSKRMKVTEEFRDAKTGIMFSSDVVARGIDIPGVSLVMQIGLPMNGEQYVHRLGRTARAGAQGHGILLLADFELPFLRTPDMRQLPLQPLPLSADHTAALAQAHQMVRLALLRVEDESKAQAYQAFLGYYKSNLRLLGWNSDTLIQTANYYAKEVLFYKGGGHDVETPPLLAKTVGMMGLKGAAGLNVVKQLPGKENGSGGRGGVRGGASSRGGGNAQALPNGAGTGRPRHPPRSNVHTVPGSAPDGPTPPQQNGGARRGGFRGRGRPRGGPPA